MPRRKVVLSPGAGGGTPNGEAATGGNRLAPGEAAEKRRDFAAMVEAVGEVPEGPLAGPVKRKRGRPMVEAVRLPHVITVRVNDNDMAKIRAICRDDASPAQWFRKIVRAALDIGAVRE